MGSRGGTGIEIELDLVPQRETGMTAYEIMLSESQERMLLVADQGREEEVFRVFKKWGLDAVTVGQVTGDGLLRVRHHGDIVAEIPNQPLADSAPLYDRPHTKPLRQAPMDAPEFTSQDLTRDLETLLASADICSKRWIWQQYDYQVRTNTIAGPGSDAAILRVKETGESLAMSLDGNARYCYLSPREGAQLIVAECCRNLAVVGAEPVGATNNLNFGNPERPEIMAQLVEAIEGIAEACRHFETPITGGNVSLYNETLGEGIWPTPVVGIVGLMKTGAPVGTHFREPGRAVMLIGSLDESDPVRFGGTQYAKVILKQLWGLPPALDMGYEKRVHAAVREIVRTGLAESAHDLSDGGLAVGLAECSFGPDSIGACVYVDEEGSLPIALFHEGPSRILISTSEPRRVQQMAAAHGVGATQIGVTIKDRLQIINHGTILIDGEVQGLKRAWEGALEHMLHS
jgi:phosphoribosylformylglycinamidine synthase